MRLAFNPSGQLTYRPELNGLGITESEYGAGMLTNWGQKPATNWGNVATGGAIAGTFAGIQTALTTGSVVQGGIMAGLSAAAMIPGPQQPFIIAAAALAGPIMQMFKGCGKTCVQATEIANQAEQALVKIKDDYLSQPVRTRSSQLVAIHIFDDVLGKMYQACSNPALVVAGQKCVSERLVRGGTAPWCPTGTGCDWLTLYRDPIANDTGVVDDPASSGVPFASTESGGFPMPLLLGAGAILLAVLMAGGE